MTGQNGFAETVPLAHATLKQLPFPKAQVQPVLVGSWHICEAMRKGPTSRCQCLDASTDAAGHIQWSTQQCTGIHMLL